MQELRQRIDTDVFDSVTLMAALRNYAAPRDKVSALLRKGVIVRVRSGLYVFGPALARHPCSRELLANLVYGPSYVSLDYALSVHGLIPEGVEVVTSVCSGRPKTYRTPLGRFVYRPMPVAGFWIGVRRVSLDATRSYLIASPSKALADMLREHRGVALRTKGDLVRYLTGERRIDETALPQLDADELELTAHRYRSRKVILLAGLVRQLQSEKPRATWERVDA